MHRIAIAPDGSVTTIYADELLPVLEELGTASVRRASHVEPHTDKATGRVQWYAHLWPVGGPSHMGPFDTRAEALAAEVTWLNRHLSQLENNSHANSL